MRNLVVNRFVVAALAIIVLGGLYGLAGLGHTIAFAEGAPLHPATRAAVSAAVSACPSPGSLGVTSGGIAVGTAPAAAGAGQAVVSRLVPAGSAAPGAQLATLTRPGQLEVRAIRPAPAVPKKLLSPAGQPGGSVPATAARGGVMVSAAGAMAQGIEVEQTGQGGLVTARCEGPGTDFWFVGPGESSAADVQLYLMNVDSQPASAGVEALTDSGPTLAGADSGITVPAHGMVVQSLVKLLRGSRVVALHVSASSGRIVAAVRVTKNPRKPGAWLPAAAAPSRHLVLAGLPGSAGTRDLYLAVPGSNNAQVKLTAVTAKGSYRPTGGGGVQLAGGSAAAVALPSLGGITAAIEISSSVPVVASILVPGGAAGAPGAFAVGSDPLREQGVVADNPALAGVSASIVLSAPRRAASVRIAVAAEKSGLAPQSGKVIQVAAGRTVVVRLRPPRGSARASAFMVVITPQPGSGPVYAGRVLTVSRVPRSILAVVSSPTWIPLPGVRDSLTTVLP